MKDLRRGRVRWRTRQDDVAEPSVPAMNEREWKKDVIELMFRDESFCEDHRPVLRLCAEGPDVESGDQDGSKNNVSKD